ncbi:MAG TPA: hypothetical protein VN688_28270 [Gemmataceae bacterium]|nr:hypothetical protein [Gemmataceae bacterium]
MFMRQLAIAALLGTILISTGCSCHRKNVVGASPCCGGAVAVPAVPPPPAPVQVGFGAAAPCPSCVGH